MEVTTKGDRMKALVYEGPGSKSWRDVPDPVIEADGDAIVRVDATTICGTDLHILKGDVPETPFGTVLGHEAVGTVVAVGTAVRNRAIGDRVLVSCITSCGRCAYCLRGHPGQCQGGGGWILGHTIDGTQAEYVRVPYADMSTHPVPECLFAKEALMLSDIVPTSYEVGVRNGHVEPGDTVAIVGAGPIGLAAIAAASLRSPSLIVVIDVAEARLEAAKHFGADVTLTNRGSATVEQVQALTDGGLGVDVAIEAVGVPETFELCTELVRPGGHVANIGVHGHAAILHLESLWIRDVTITTGLVDTVSTPTLLRLLESRKLHTLPLISHDFGLDQMLAAYDTFSHPDKTGALKVAILRSGDPEDDV
jgi:alcohol dehydrogenase